MRDIRAIFRKYFEVLNKQNYDIIIEEDIENADSIEHFNELLSSVILNMSQDELILSLKQSIKRDLSKGQGLGEEDEVWDEVNEWIEETMG